MESRRTHADTHPERTACPDRQPVEPHCFAHRGHLVPAAKISSSRGAACRKRQDAGHAGPRTTHRKPRHREPVPTRRRNRAPGSPVKTSSRQIFLAGLFMVPLAIAGPAATQSKPTPNLSMENAELRAQLSPRDYTTLAAEIPAKVNR